MDTEDVPAGPAPQPRAAAQEHPAAAQEQPAAAQEDRDGQDASGRSGGLPGGPGSVDDRAGLARALTGLRERAGLSVRDVARLAGLPLGTAGGYLSGRHLPQPATVGQFERMLAALGVPEPERAGWVALVGRLRRAPGPRPASAQAPYRGLAPYDVAHAALFVGREAAVDDLVARVADAGAGPVVVLAASGSGKSSLLRAGLVARLRETGDVAVVTTPGDDPPPDALVAATGARVLVVDQLEEALLAPDGGAALLDGLGALHAAGTTVVLGLRADVVDRALAHDGLARWLADRPVLVAPLTPADLRRVVEEPARRVGLDVEEALVDVLVADATSGASAAGRGTLDPGVLPLVSHALYATWRAASGRRLTLAQYRAVGGLGGAIAQTAEGVVGGWPPERLAVARRVLLGLVHVRDHHVAGRPVALDDLAGTSAAGDAADAPGRAATVEVVDALVAARLLTADRGHVRLAHEALLTAWPRLAGWIEDDREALRLHGRLAEAARHWDDAGRDPDLELRGVQLEAALAWRTGGGAATAVENAYLDASRGSRDRQAAAQRRSARRLRVLSAGLAVLTVSTAVLAGAAAAQSRTRERERDLAVSRQLAVTAQSLAATDPDLSAQVAAAALATAGTLEARSALLSTTGTAVPARLGSVGALVNAVAVSPDGALLAAATDGSAVALWALGDEPHPVGELPVDDGALYAVAFTPDGRGLLAGGDAGLLRAWSVEDPDDPRPLPVAGPAAGATLYDLAVDDGVVAAGASDGTVHLWTVGPGTGPTAPEPAAVLPVAPGGATQAVALRDGVLAAGGSTGALTLWDVRDPAAPAAAAPGLPLGEAPVAALAWSPDGTTLAAGTTAGVVHVVDARDPAAPEVGTTLTGPASWVNDVAFSPDGGLLAAAGSDQRLWVWDLATGAVAGGAASPTTLLAARWSPDGGAVYASGADGVLREWVQPGPVLAGFASIPGQGAFGTVAGAPLVVTSTTDGVHVWDVTDPARARHRGSAAPPRDARLDGAVAVSDALGIAVVGDTTGGIHAYDLRDPGAPVLLGSAHAHTDWVDTVAFDATGTRLAASSDDGTVTTWDLSGGVADGLPATPTGRVGDLGGAVYVVAFSPDGGTLVAAVLSGSVRLLDVRDLAAPRPLGDPVTGPAGYVYSAAYSPDGRTVAATGNDGTVWLWDVEDPAAPDPLGPPLRWGEGYGTNSAFSPDGHRLAVGRTDGTVRVWDVTDPAHPTRWASLSGADGTVYGVEFSPDGTHLTAAAADRTARVWDLTVEGALGRVCATATRGTSLSDDEWERLAGEVDRPQACR
ncbi:nSTAND1 domain-containing NTPase [Cellulomonas sp. P4]|uniref:nSTAND1 domain-containing NTPase n=1 Tax=Cellulomonas sp. P4 TaxID=3142533 RepID=UPI0031BACFEB